MNIVVLVKQVPAVSDIQIDKKNNNLVRVGAPSTLNPVDANAIEAAIALKEAVGGTVTLVTMGTALAGEIMRGGIAVGADKGVLVSDEALAGSDTLATGKALAKAIEKIGGADLVLAGKRSTDGDTGQIPPTVAQRLGFSLLSYAESLEVDGNVLKGTRKNNGGLETVEVTLPAVCSVMETANTPRQPKVRGTMKAKRAVFDVLRVEDLGLDAAEVGKAGSATEVTELFAPEPHPVGNMISGDSTADAVKKLVAELASKNLL
ncbi:electron transfer flavoprotein subunit beta/FixA family protein [uncultured Megasphaera sp.]|uniref:electron transfer flavoprotein subunit beta/FixA family protein n=1 Tax=uncultured Megasphaera sp. TaxID=165188 RepID=UPI00265A8BD8|nr:electron transfer flavoprotein subunit beta/FixA family protein [uncultured Megasphaera sp.]